MSQTQTQLSLLARTDAVAPAADIILPAWRRNLGIAAAVLAWAVTAWLMMRRGATAGMTAKDLIGPAGGAIVVRGLIGGAALWVAVRYIVGERIAFWQALLASAIVQSLAASLTIASALYVRDSLLLRGAWTALRWASGFVIGAWLYGVLLTRPTGARIGTSKGAIFSGSAFGLLASVNVAVHTLKDMSATASWVWRMLEKVF